MNFFYPVLACLLIASAIPLNVKAQTKTFVDPRDSNAYEIVELNDLEWLRENLRYRSPSNYDTLIAPAECGVFYLQEDAGKACPEGWRLPKEKEVKALLKLDKKGRLKLVDTLKIALCGRIDYGKHSKPGMQNTFWLDEDLVDGHIMHWHTFHSENELHSHNVIQARRKFPVRCVRESPK